jgi:hypothetical protein
MKWRVSSPNKISTNINIIFEIDCVHHTFALSEDNFTAKFHKERTSSFVLDRKNHPNFQWISRRISNFNIFFLNITNMDFISFCDESLQMQIPKQHIPLPVMHLGPICRPLEVWFQCSGIAKISQKSRQFQIFFSVQRIFTVNFPKVGCSRTPA